MDDILAHLSKGKNPPPEDWPYEEAKQLFLKPSVKPSSEIDVSSPFSISPLNLASDDATDIDAGRVFSQLKWEEPNVEGLVDFLVRDKGFS